MVRLLVVPILILIFGLPVLLVALPAILWPVLPVWIATLLLGPLAYAALFVTTAGVISLPFQKAIIPGKFPRDLSHPIYGRRRLYGLCWTSVYYHKPVYYLCLTIPMLKWLTFRLFGYRGSMDFTVYPDTWIRDLPLLDFGPGAYVANRATLGTNMPLKDGRILVEPVRIGRGAMIGHLVMLAAGTSVGDNAEVLHGSACNARVTIRDNASVGATCNVDTLVSIGESVKIGNSSAIAFGASIANNLILPFGSLVPRRARITTQDDVDGLLSSNNSSLPRLRQEVSRFDPLTAAGAGHQSKRTAPPSNNEKE